MRIRSLALWRLRVAREAPRYLLCAAAATGLVASARYALFPPRPLVADAAQRVAPDDRAAEGYAVLFARRFLTWNADEPQSAETVLSGFLGPGVERGLGAPLAARGRQTVQWAEVVQEREPSLGQHVYTVAAQTSSGLEYLAVGVQRMPAGRLAVTGYPAFVGAPASEPARPQPDRHEALDAGLATVVTRALRNYLAGSESDLQADLSPGARVSVPSVVLRLVSAEQLEWSQDGRSVLALVQAQDERGTRYTLDYELDVERNQGRWEISAVEVDPDA